MKLFSFLASIVLLLPGLGCAPGYAQTRSVAMDSAGHLVGLSTNVFKDNTGFLASAISPFLVPSTTTTGTYYKVIATNALFTNVVSGTVAASGTVTGSNFVGFGIVPLGTVLPWMKTLTGTPGLPAGWVECNGQTLSDAASVFNGVVIPDLNGSLSGTGLYVRGATTSGTTNGSDSYALSMAASTTDQPAGVVQVAAGTDFYVGSETHVHGLTVATTDPTSLPPPTMTAVYIIRVK